MSERLITKDKDLARFLDELGTPPWIAVDTEFLTEKTYVPKLCLIQVGHGDTCAAIDPLSDIDLDPLLDLLDDPDIVKVFHAGEQDLGIFQNDFDFVPAPVYDTQVAAMVCGYGRQVGYARIVEQVTGIRIDKGSQMVDWSRRPIRERDLKYAIEDVRRLGPVYEAVKKDVAKRGRTAWIEEEMEDLEDPKRYKVDLDTLWEGLKLKSPTRRRLAILRELVTFREREARRRNSPRQWILKDNAIRELAAHPPKSTKELARIRNIGGAAKGKLGEEVMRCIREANALPESECPEVPPRSRRVDVPDNAVALLRALLTRVADKEEVAAAFIATRGELERYATGRPTRLDHGWRQELFGKLATDLLEGRLGLTVRDGEVEFLALGD